jgi:hypothetical protein
MSTITGALDTAPSPLLEMLRRAEASLENRPYEYSNWTQCTCGHIYVGAVGRKARIGRHVHDSRNYTFAQVLAYVAEANDVPPGECWCGEDRRDPCASCLAEDLSIATRMRAARIEDGEDKWDDLAVALKFVRTAIAKHEREIAEAMRAVAAEAERVVALVDMPEAVPA